MLLPVVLGLGSNRRLDSLSCIDILVRAVSDLSSVLADLTCSSVYKTRAMYVTDQDDFYNMCVAGRFDTSNDTAGAYSLLDKIHLIENRYGRNRAKEIRFGPRPLDIDIELFGLHNIDEDDLTVPHPRLEERAFVLVPLLEIFTESSDNKNCKAFDSKKINELTQACSALKGCESGVEKYMSAEDFSKRLKYGTSIGRDSDR